jgi:hypothetical protein
MKLKVFAMMAAQKTHFSEGVTFDQIFAARNK